MSLEEMVGKEFLQEISTKDADLILEALKQYGNDELIDKWISVKIIATEARKGIVKRKKINRYSIEFYYTNWKGFSSKRNIIPIELVYQATEYHSKEQWLLVAFDKDKDDIRFFSVKDIHFPINIDKCWQTNYGDLNLILPKIDDILVKDIINIYYSKE